jgi:hypothetical protein
MLWTVFLNELNPIIGSIGFFSSLSLAVAFGLWRTVDEYEIDKVFQTSLSDRRKRGEIVDTFPVRGRSRADFPIIDNGNPQFSPGVNRILDELEQKVPEHFREVLEYLPKAEYNASLGGYSYSDGRFSIDASRYENFRWVFLHEAGHNIRGKQNNDWSEEAANDYANQVTALL